MCFFFMPFCPVGTFIELFITHPSLEFKVSHKDNHRAVKFYHNLQYCAKLHPSFLYIFQKSRK